MHNGISLQELAIELDRQNAAKRDFVADTRSIAVRPVMVKDKEESLQIPTALEMEINKETFPVSHHSLRQIGGKLKIPAKYVDRLASDHPDLLATNINGLFSREPKRQMVRTMDGNVRAFLSDKYRPLDNFDLAQAVLPGLINAGAKVYSCDVTPNKLYIKAVLEDMVATIPPPPGAEMGQGHTMFVETVQAGLQIGNSEIGAGRLSVQPAVFTKRCTNYASFNDTSFFKVHLGRAIGAGSEADVWEYFSNETRAKSDEAVWNQVNDLVKAAMDGTIFNSLVGRLTEAREDKIDEKAKIPEVIEVTSKRFGFTEDEKQGILFKLIEGGDLTRFGLHNAVTAFSGTVEDYDRASELENIGGRIIELPKNHWREIAKAA